jgi:hypothetical protein
MLYLAIDQHRKQLTVNIRNESGDVICKRRVKRNKSSLAIRRIRSRGQSRCSPPSPHKPSSEKVLTLCGRPSYQGAYVGRLGLPRAISKWSVRIAMK